MANSKTEVGKTQDEPETLSGTRKKGSAQKKKKKKKNEACQMATGTNLKELQGPKMEK